MKFAEINIKIQQEEFIINNKRCLFWPKQKLLAISDLHLGKSGHFRKNGIPIPSTISRNDISNLEFLLNFYQPETFIIIGDFVHADYNLEWNNFSDLKSKFTQTQFTLIKGNHDKLKDEFFNKMGFNEIHNQLKINSFLFQHEFQNTNNEFQICGHIHPGISFKMPTKKIEKFPAFVLTTNHFLLPAFSQFTGLAIQPPMKNHQYFIFNHEIIVKI